MKKTRFLVLALAVAIMLMGAGYAYWTETLTIENTVTTGKLDFTFQNASVVQVDEYMDYDGVSSCSVRNGDDNTIDIVLEDMYPGAEATVKFDLLNSGTMAAKVKNFAVTNFEGNQFFKVISFEVGGVEQLTSPITLADLNTGLQGKVIDIEKAAAKTFQITFEIDEAAGNDDINENAGKGNVAPYAFSLTAAGLQYNDDVN